VIFAPTTPPGMAAGNPDTWDGYVGQRERVFDFLERERLRNLVILTGDAHSSWALDVPRAPWKNYRTSTGEGSLAVEMVTPAISSTPPSVFSGSGGEGLLTALRIALPHLKFLDGQRRGYVLVALTPQSMAASWFFVPDVRTRSSTEIPGPTLICERGSNHFQQA